MADVHYFDVKIAELYGVNAAILLQNIWHWVKKNEANGKHFHDGAYWTYNSTKAFSEMFPYLTQKQVRAALEKLVECGILQTGNYNEMKYDRTLWYSVTQTGKTILLSGQMDLPLRANGNASGGEPIPNINTNTKPNTKPNKGKKAFVPPTLEEIEAYCKQRNNSVNAKRFFDFFDASSWIDSKGNPVRNWKQKVITWESFSKPEERDAANGQNSGNSQQTRYGHYI